MSLFTFRNEKEGTTFLLSKKNGKYVFQVEDDREGRLKPEIFDSIEGATTRFQLAVSLASGSLVHQLRKNALEKSG